MLDGMHWSSGVAAPSSHMTNLKKIRPIVFAMMMMFGLVLSGPALAQDSSMNPLIPGGNSAPPGHVPKAVPSDPLYDFGSALEGTMVKHTFTIKNTGQGYLDIQGREDFVRMHHRRAVEDARGARRQQRYRGRV